MTERKPFAITVQDLVARGRNDIPAELITSTHLIYNSPAALAFNSPGAQGFGVKRAGLSIPGSVMILIGPGCCGRNTTILSEMGGYSDRFFFYIMDETDIVTGRHLKKMPQAVCEVVDSLPEKPSVVMAKFLRYGSRPCLNAVRSLFSAICLRPRRAFSMSTMT